jgi:branched-chain amino acid aminotransferase
MKIWLNDRLVNSTSAHVSPFDHGFLYGDGIYETVRAYGYKVFHWSAHDRRLRQSARRIALKCPWSSQYLESCITRVLKTNREPDASVRITITRGPGPLGLSPRGCPKPTLVLLLHPRRDVEKYRREGISIGITKIRRNPPEALDPQIKSNNSLNTILAKIEAESMGVFEAILTNLRGELTEGTTSNIFWVKRKRIFTPAVTCGLLEGVTREAVIRLAGKVGYRVQEGRFKPQALLKADEVFLSSTTLEIAPVVRLKFAGHLKSHRIGTGRPGPIAQQLYALLRDSIQKEINS